MVEEVGGVHEDRLGGPSPAERSELQELARLLRAGRRKDAADEVTPTGLRELLDRVKHAGVYRKERVHEVLEKLQRGELVTSEAVREAAERILREGV